MCVHFMSPVPVGLGGGGGALSTSLSVLRGVASSFSFSHLRIPGPDRSSSLLGRSSSLNLLGFSHTSLLRRLVMGSPPAEAGVEAAASPEKSGAAARDCKPDEAGDGASADAPVVTLSKSARKKMEKRERIAQERKEKKAAAKEQKRKESAQKKDEAYKLWDTLTEEEREERMARKRANIDAMRGSRDAKRARLDEAAKTAVRVCVDLDFLNFMGEKEVNSIKTQLGYVYASNSKATHPLSVTFASYTEDYEKALRTVESWRNWRGVCFEPRSYVDAFTDTTDGGAGGDFARVRPVSNRTDIVYLTADAEEELGPTLDPTKIYVIGGIVDHNQHKGLCHSRAQRDGVSCARIPIDAAVQARIKGSHIFTVNHVFDMLLGVNGGSSWSAVVEQNANLRTTE